MNTYFEVGNERFETRKNAIARNTYFEVGDTRLESREKAIEQINRWKMDTRTFSVCEVQNTEVTRKSMKGNIISEIVQGTLEQVPRIISAKALNPTYAVVDGVSRHWKSFTHFEARAEADQERAKRQSEIERLAALTDADINFHTVT